MPARKKEELASKRVGIWIRVSTEDQAKGESPQNHEIRARHYAESKGWFVAEVYHLEGVSGKAVTGHPEARRMLKDIERGHISALIFSKLARLGRNTKELLEFADYFQSHDADLISLQEAIDTSTPAGRLFYTMIAAMAHWEREEIASRIAASIPVRAKLGKHVGGPAPFGYQWKDKKLVPHPEEAPVRRLVHEYFLKYRRIGTVTRLLTEAGHRSRKGKPFSNHGISIMLRDSTPKGLHRANYITYDANAKAWKLKPESDWVFQEVEPILESELWDACAAMLEERDASHTPRAKRAVQLFAGVLFCGCGAKMYVPSNTPKYVCQKCRTKIPIGDLEDIFIEQLQDYMLSRQELASYLDAKNKDLQGKQEILDTLALEEKRLRAEMEKVYQLYMADQITVEGFGSRYKPMEERLKQLQEEIPKTEAAADLLKVNFLSGDQILNQAQNLATFWPDMSQEGKRRVVESIVERITLDKDEIQIDLFYLPTLHQSDQEPDPGKGNGTSGIGNGSPSGSGEHGNGSASLPLSSISTVADTFSENMAKSVPALQGWDHTSQKSG